MTDFGQDCIRRRVLSRGPQTGFETITFRQTTLLTHGVGGRQYGASEDIETLERKNNASTSRLGAIEAFACFLHSRNCSASRKGSQKDNVGATNRKRLDFVFPILPV
jgi:hypothetical protein